MNTLKIECSKEDYIIKTCTAKSEKEIIMELPEDWNCDYVDAVLWEDDICEILENNGEHILLIPKCGEMLLLEVMEDEKKHISMPAKYDGLEMLVIKI